MAKATIGVRLRELRGARPVMEVANHFRVDRQSVYGWERAAHDFDEDRLEELAAYYHVTPAFLRYGGEPTLDYWEGAFRTLGRMQVKLGQLSEELAEERSADRKSTKVGADAVHPDPAVPEIIAANRQQQGHGASSRGRTPKRKQG